jgi:hypothetical protein
LLGSAGVIRFDIAIFSGGGEEIWVHVVVGDAVGLI